MQIIQSKLLNKFSNLTHYFSSKDDGNLAFHVEDDADSVRKNHKRLAKKLNYDVQKLLHMKQIHSNRVKIVDARDSFETPLMVMVADCSPILFYDDAKEVIAVAHAGREGAFTNIVQNVIDSFREKFHTNVRDIYVSVGANIKECCYEVGEEIFLEAKSLHLESFVHIRENSYFLDISGILKKQLLASGVLEQNIEFIPACSSCQTERYYSYRAEGKTGRFCGIVSIL